MNLALAADLSSFENFKSNTFAKDYQQTVNLVTTYIETYIQTLEKRLHLPELGGNAGQGDTDLGGDDHLLLADSAVLLALLLEQIAVPLLAHFDLGLDLLHLLRVLRLAEQLQILLDLLGILLQDELPLLLDFLLHFQHFLPFFFFLLLLDL